MWSVVPNCRHVECNVSLPKRKVVGDGYFDIVYIGVLVLGLRVFNSCTINQSYSKYLTCWETSIIENVRLITSLSLYQSKFIYIFCPEIISYYKSFIKHFFTLSLYSTIYPFKNVLSKHSSFKNTVEVFILFQYTVLNNSTCHRINLVDPVSNQNVLNLEDQRLFTNSHGKQIGTPSGTVLVF